MDALAEWLGRRPAKPTVRRQKRGLGAGHVTLRLFKSTFVNFAGVVTKANADRSLRGLMDKAPPSASPDTFPSGNRSEPGGDAGSIPAAGTFAMCWLGARHVRLRIFKSTFVIFAGVATKAIADRSLRGLMDKAPPSTFPDTNRSEPGGDAGSIPAAGTFAIPSFWPELGATQTRWVNAVAPAELKCVRRFRVAMRERAVLEI